MRRDRLGRLYDRLTPEERFRLDVEAMARGDGEESRKLTDTCPRRNYVMNDWGFVGRQQAARELAIVAYADLVKCLDKLQMIGAFRAMMPHLLTAWENYTHAAYFDGHHAGSHHAWRLAGKGGAARMGDRRGGGRAQRRPRSGDGNREVVRQGRGDSRPALCGVGRARGRAGSPGARRLVGVCPILRRGDGLGGGQGVGGARATIRGAGAGL
jgi:hypothetical protein